eukprot:5266659-Pyramimonas_sp.AAC.1
MLSLSKPLDLACTLAILRYFPLGWSDDLKRLFNSMAVFNLDWCVCDKLNTLEPAIAARVGFGHIVTLPLANRFRDAVPCIRVFAHGAFAPAKPGWRRRCSPACWLERFCPSRTVHLHLILPTTDLQLTLMVPSK